LALVAAALLLVFFWAPPAEGLGFDFKIFFFHVPAAWLMLLSALVSGVFAARSLLGEKDDTVPAAAAELAFLFGLLVMITGPIWAWRAWGKPWIWEPRLTTSLVCWLTFGVAVAARGFFGRVGRKVALALEVLGAANVPLVYVSVRFWEGSHHPPVSVVPDLGGRYMVALMVAMAAMTAVWALFFRLCLRQKKLAEKLDRLEARARMRDRGPARVRDRGPTRARAG
jgi:heme exporter protein C